MVRVRVRVRQQAEPGVTECQTQQSRHPGGEGSTLNPRTKGSAEQADWLLKRQMGRAGGCEPGPYGLGPWAQGPLAMRRCGRTGWCRRGCPAARPRPDPSSGGRSPCTWAGLGVGVGFALGVGVGLGVRVSVGLRAPLDARRVGAGAGTMPRPYLRRRRLHLVSIAMGWYSHGTHCVPHCVL